jgi:hypothetical protein
MGNVLYMGCLGLELGSIMQLMELGLDNHFDTMAAKSATKESRDRV